MTSHRRVKDIAYDSDDDYGDDYGEEDEGVSASDKEQLREGTLKVKAILGPDISVTDQEIEDALWHYYYDIDKSATYLKNKHVASQPKQPKQSKSKPVSKFDQAVNAAAKATPQAPKGQTTAYPIPSTVLDTDMDLGLCMDSTTYFFKDSPWMNVPSDRKGTITIEPLHERGRLLGGSSKPSKLAALAAARKKKQEEERANASSASQLNAPDRAISLLDRLGTEPKKPSQASLATAAKPESKDSPSSGTRIPPRKFPERRKRSPSPPLVASKPSEPIEPPNEEQEPGAGFNLPDLIASPSTFASTMAGRAPIRLGSNSQTRDNSMFSLFAPDEPDFTKSNPFLGPSPDDVVTNAQSKGNIGKATQTKQRNEEKGADDVTNGVATMAVEESSRIKSKNLDVKKEFEKSNLKRGLSFVVIGHVDHGKSTLMGRLLYDLKIVDERSLGKLRKEAENIGKSSFALAWVMDQTSEERERGVTVDIATNSFETEKTRFTILDAPGHRDFIPNMIAGASQADIAVLVIDAGTNSFESGLRGQTKEHALLARSIGVQRLIIVINKMDTAKWAQDRYHEISQQMSAFLTSAGFQASKVAFVPCAGLTGDNVTRRSTEKAASWYSGNTLIEELEASSPTVRSIEKPLRLTISDVFRGGITNPVSISGRIDAGSLQVGDPLIAMPSGESAIVKGIEIDNEPADWAVAGQIVNLHLADIDPIHLRLGDIICSPTQPIQNVQSFTAKILAFEHVMPMSVNVHRGRLNMTGKITKLVSTLDKNTGQVLKKKPRVIQPGSVAKVEVEMEKPIPLEAGVRVVLRSEAQTIATGLLESVK